MLADTRRAPLGKSNSSVKGPLKICQDVLAEVIVLLGMLVTVLWEQTYNCGEVRAGYDVGPTEDTNKTL
jgi:hypothetical protein